jgi:WD40 repeat protein
MSLHRGFILATDTYEVAERFYTSSVEGNVGEWNLHDGALLRKWQCHVGPVNTLACDHRGQRILTGGHDRSIGIWDLKDGRLVHRLQGHSGGVLAVSVSNKWIASGSYDSTVAIWDRATGKRVSVLYGHDDAVTGVTFVDENMLVSASRDCSVAVWDLERQLRLYVLGGHRHWVTSVAALPDRRAVSVGEDGQIKLWDIDRRQAIWSISQPGNEPIWGLSVDLRGQLAIVGAVNAASIVDLKSQEIRNLPNYPGRTPRAISVCESGDLAVLGDDVGDIQVYDIKAGRMRYALTGNNKGILSAALDGNRNLAMSTADGAVEFEFEGEIKRREDAHAYFTYIIRRIDADRVISGSFDGSICIWNSATAQPLNQLNYGSLVISISGSRSGKRLLVSGGGGMKLWRLPAAEPVWVKESLGSGSHTVSAISPDGRTCVSAGEDSLLQVWTFADGSVLSLELPCNAISALDYLPGSQGVIVATASGSVLTVDIVTGDIELLHSEHEDWIRTVRVCSDGRYIVSASQNCVGRVYDMYRGQLVFLEQLRPLSLPAADVSPFGELVFVDTDGSRVNLLGPTD